MTEEQQARQRQSDYPHEVPNACREFAEKLKGSGWVLTDIDEGLGVWAVLYFRRPQEHEEPACCG